MTVLKVQETKIKIKLNAPAHEDSCTAIEE